MATVFTNVTTNKSGKIVRGVRVLRSEYSKDTKRDNLQYLGTIPQGVVNVPSKIAGRLLEDERAELKAKLVVVARFYWLQRIDELTKQLDEAKDAVAELAPLGCRHVEKGASTYGRASR